MKRLLVIVFAALLTITGVLGWYLSTTLPLTTGAAVLPGLKERVVVTRDSHGVPTIKAQSDHDAYAALGYVHAQDRFWQMEMNRRAGAGRLSEVLGPATLETDKFLRTLGLYRLAAASLSYLRPEVRDALQAYADGVNGWLRTKTGAVTPEFVLLRYQPEPWTPVDSLVWSRLMGLQLGGNWRQELLRQRLQGTVSPERAAMLWAPYPAGAPTTVTLAQGPLDRMLAAIPEIALPHLASNEWVVSGAHTASGKPVLANDPHLGFSAPVLWYLATLDAPGLYVSGATVPGVPFHLLGHNRTIAWGMTSTESDLMDLFVEKEQGGDYLRPDGPVPFETRDEVIQVRDAAPVTLKVRSTVHGPVISDVLGERTGGMVLALSSATLQPEDRTAQAIYRLNRAKDWDGFVTALADFDSPQQNFAYADTSGDIGFIVPGKVPVRKAGDGLTPNAGWTGEHDWTGWVPFDALPRLHNPPRGRIVNANNKVVPEGYPYLISATWPEPFRAERILQVLEQDAAHDPAHAKALQYDIQSLAVGRAKEWLPGLEVKGDAAKAALDKLRIWDGRMDRNRAEPLIFEAWMEALQRRLLEDKLGPLAQQFAVVRPLFLELAMRGQGDWCDDTRTPQVETCPQVASTALEDAVATLTRQYGADMSAWHWGDAHQAVFAHPVLSHAPVLGWLTTLRIPTDGGDFTVNRGSYDPGDFTHSHGAGLRAVYDLANLDNSQFVIATGQSGNVLSRRYRDQLQAWRDGDTFRIGPTATPAGLLTLEPQ
jgi:penicillin amidase